MFSLLEKLDPRIDYFGQEFALRLMYIILLVGYSIAFIVGFALKELKYTLLIGIATVIFGFLATIPSWPYLRRNPVKFKKEIKIKSE